MRLHSGHLLADAGEAVACGGQVEPSVVLSSYLHEWSRVEEGSDE